MNIIEQIHENLHKLSPQEKKVADFILDNLSDMPNLSLKIISRRLNVQSSVVTKTLSKLGMVGFKNLKEHAEKTHYYKESDVKQNFIKTFGSDLHNIVEESLKVINFNAIQSICEEMATKRPKIILFSTGKTKSYISTFYFYLNEIGYDVYIYSSLYDTAAFDVKGAMVFVVSITGNNNKCFRYLGTIANKKTLKTIIITANEEILIDSAFDYHLFGSVNSHYSDDPKALPITIKYPVIMILDMLLIEILKYLDDEGRKRLTTIRSRNRI